MASKRLSMLLTTALFAVAAGRPIDPPATLLSGTQAPNATSSSAAPAQATATASLSIISLQTFDPTRTFSIYAIDPVTKGANDRLVSKSALRQPTSNGARQFPMDWSRIGLTPFCYSLADRDILIVPVCTGQAAIMAPHTEARLIILPSSCPHEPTGSV